MNYLLFDTHIRQQFLPFSYTRSVADVRCGILTMREKWENYLHQTTHTVTVDYLQNRYTQQLAAQNYLIAANVFPNMYLLQEITAMASGTVLVNGELIIAYCLSEADTQAMIEGKALPELQTVQTQFQTNALQHPWDIFSSNDQALRDDFELLTLHKSSQSISKTNTVIGDALQVYIAEGAVVEASVLNTNSGPIYIGANAEIMEGCMVRGPFALCDGAQLKMGTKIYGATTIGPNCKVGGEVNNSVFFANSSKAHDGFIGNSVIGEWCNLGADTNNSNLKNNYEEVKLWSEQKGTFVKTGLQFCGLMMADHSKCGINTMFNTGTVVGVSANIFGAGFPRNFIPSFSWGGASGFSDYKIDKALQTMKLVFARRNKQLTQSDEDLYNTIYNLTAQQR
jgi:UDP-N-acetylglucosamine diphosphorylase/glucosamine-1-phosphate N-acetyltransferase